MRINYKNQYLWLGLIIAIGGFLRLYHLGYKSLWLDEAVNYLNALGTFEEILEKNNLRGSGPPAFTLIIHAITKFSHSEFWLRFPSCMAGILSIPMAYLAFKSHAGKWGSVLGCLLLALSPMQIKYSQELREYSFAVLLTLALIYFMSRAIEHKDSKHYLLFGFTAAIAIQFQYGLALVVAVFSAIILLYCVIDRNKKIGPLFIGLVPIILSVLLVWYISLRHQYRPDGFSYLYREYFDSSPASLLRFCIYNTDSIVQFAFNDKCKFLLLLLVVIGCFYSIIKKRYLPSLLVIGIFGTFLSAGLLSLYPYGGIRQTIFLSVTLYLTASVGIDYLQKKSAYLMIGGLLGLFMIYGTMDSVDYLNRESVQNIKPFLSILNKEIQPEDRIFVSLGSEPAFEYYFDSLSDRLVFPLDFHNKQREFDYKQRADIIAAQPGRIWLLFSQSRPQDTEIMIHTIKEKRKVRLVSPVDEYAKLYIMIEDN